MIELVGGSLFSGIGGLELGLERAFARRGIRLRTKFQAEQDPFCREALATHFPEAKRHADVRDVGIEDGPVDLLCGGFPCQDVSVAGKGAGLSGARSGLWSEYARIVRDLRPRFVVVENVSALLSRGLGRVLGDLSALRYDTWWDCVPASALGAPHRRDRLYLVAWRVPDALGGGLRNGPKRRRRAAPAPDGGNPESEHLGAELADGDRERREALERHDQWELELAIGREGALADAPRARREGAVGKASPGEGGGGRSREPSRKGLADAVGVGRERERRGGLLDGERTAFGDDADRRDRPLWPPAPDDLLAWRRVPADAQPAFCRLADGVSPLVARRRQRLRALGNAVVPAVAEVPAAVVADLIARGF